MGLPIENAVLPRHITYTQAVQVIFSQKRNESIHPPLFFNEAPVVMKDEERSLSMVLDSALNFLVI